MVFVLALVRATIEDEAVATTELVLLFTSLVMLAVAEFVFELTEAMIDVDAELRSESVASEPDVRPAPVRVRVPFDHTSDAKVPNVVRVRVPADQTLAGIAVIAEAIEPIDEPRDVDA